jgi:hypothetical protein
MHAYLAWFLHGRFLRSLFEAVIQETMHEAKYGHFDQYKISDM